MTASRSSAVGQGLAEVRTGVGTLIAYATGPGDVASDGDGPHSPFTGALLDHIATPGLEVRQVLGRVRDEVLKQTGDRQVPWDSSSLRGEFYFRPAEATPSGPAPPPEPPAPAVTDARSSGTFDERQLDLGFWESVRGSDAAEDFEAYLESFPDGVYAVLARRRLAELRPPPKEATAQPGTTAPEVPRAELSPPPAPLPAVATRTPDEPQAPSRGETVVTAPVAPPPPKPAEIEAGLGLSRDDWRALQRAVTALGFDTGGADGKPGQNTRKALVGWQQSKRVEATGYLGPLQRELILSEAEPKLATLEAAQPLVAAAQPSAVNDGNQPSASRSTASRKPGSVFRDCSDCPEMVIISAGSFTMGSPRGEAGRYDDEGPQRRVTFERPFALGRYEVTFAQWDACVAAGGCNGHRPDDRGWGRGARPVINVSWWDARAFAAWLSDRTGQPYRLPTEAEWEYAARAGTTTPFWTGATISTAQANYAGNLAYAGGSKGIYRMQTMLVDDPSFPANPFGLRHMTGNVREWVEDCYVYDYGAAPADGRLAVDRSDCRGRVLRGGSWSVIPGNLRSAYRDRIAPVVRVSNVGFRVARMLAP